VKENTGDGEECMLATEGTSSQRSDIKRDHSTSLTSIYSGLIAAQSLPSRDISSPLDRGFVSLASGTNTQYPGYLGSCPKLRFSGRVPGLEGPAPALLLFLQSYFAASVLLHALAVLRSPPSYCGIDLPSHGTRPHCEYCDIHTKAQKPNQKPWNLQSPV
jgi:hypothetical protein